MNHSIFLQNIYINIRVSLVGNGAIKSMKIIDNYLRGLLSNCYSNMYLICPSSGHTAISFDLVLRFPLDFPF